MKINSAEFVTSAVGPDGYPDSDLPEIAFIGRSNVGKSSLINNLLQRKKLAKTSSVPGKTQTINFYRVNEQMMLVDLPGYGFTKAPEKVSQDWRRSIDMFFRTRKNLRGVIQLVDSRHPPTQMDLRVFHWLMETELIEGVCAVKTDKISANMRQRSVKTIQDTLGVPAEIPLIAHSSKTDRGREELWKHLLFLLNDDFGETS